MAATRKKNKVAPAAKANSTKNNKKAKVAATKKSGGAKSGGGKKDGKSAAQRIMEELARAYANGKAMEKPKLVKILGIAPKTLANTLSKFKKEGTVEVDGSTLKLTAKGAEEMGDLASAGETNAEVQDRLRANMTKKQIELFELLLDGKVRSKDAVAKELGYEDNKTKAFLNLAGAVRGKEIVDYPQKDTIQLNHETCFPCDE